jgi:sugar phosphate isomerase/epimerase
MNGRPQDFMSVGIIHFMAFPEAGQDGGPVLETLKTLCEDDYFQAIEVTAIRDEAVRQQAIRLVRDSGKRAVFGAQPVLLAGRHDLNSTVPRVRQAALDAVRALIPQAKEWEATSLVVLSGPDPGEAERPLARTMFCASLKELCELSRRAAGPPVLLETFDRAPFARNRLIGPSEEAAWIADKVHPYYRSFGLVLDLSHLPLLGETPDHALKTVRQDLRHVHIGNCVLRDRSHPAYGDQHPMFGIPEGENGVAELAAFLKALLEIRYIGDPSTTDSGKAGAARNIVSFEVKPFGSQTSAQVLENAKQTLDAAWKAL